MPDFHIRRATAQDAGPLADCLDAAYSVYASRISDLPLISAGVAQSIKSSRVWVAETIDDIIGGIILVPHEEFMMLENVAVLSSSSGMGVGAALIKRAETDCVELGLHQIRLSTHIDMLENVSLYEHLGWSETGRSGNKIIMNKYL